MFFTILLVVGNTMAQAVRERTSELAVLKTLGFTDGRVLCAGARRVAVHRARRRRARALALAWLLVSGGDPTGGFLPVFILPGRDIVIGVGADARCSASLAGVAAGRSARCGCGSPTR